MQNKFNLALTDAKLLQVYEIKNTFKTELMPKKGTDFSLNEIILKEPSIMESIVFKICSS